MTTNFQYASEPVSGPSQEIRWTKKLQNLSNFGEPFFADIVGPQINGVDTNNISYFVFQMFYTAISVYFNQQHWNCRTRYELFKAAMWQLRIALGDSRVSFKMTKLHRKSPRRSTLPSENFSLLKQCVSRFNPIKSVVDSTVSCGPISPFYIHRPLVPQRSSLLGLKFHQANRYYTTHFRAQRGMYVQCIASMSKW